MKGLMLLADGFEDTEALASRDVMIRSGMEIYTCSITNRLEVVSSFGIRLKANLTIDQVSYHPYDFIYLPGGSIGVSNMKRSMYALDLIKDFVLNDRYVFAICAAPSILGKIGFLKDKNYTCYPGCEENGFEGLYHQDKEIVKDEKLITARSMSYSIAMALSIIETLLGSEKMNQVKNGIEGREKK